jgi:hypothetical protein
MKRRRVSLLFASGFAAISVFAGAYGSETPAEPIRIQRTLDFSKSKEKLYVLANEWIEKKFSFSRFVVQQRDAPRGTVTGTGVIETTIGFEPARGWFTLTFETNDLNVRVTVEDVYATRDSGGEGAKEYFEAGTEDRVKIERQLEALIEDFAIFVKIGKSCNCPGPMQPR